MITWPFSCRRVAGAICALLLSLICAGTPTPAAAWGDEGHRVVAIIANRLLDPSVRTRSIHLSANAQAFLAKRGWRLAANARFVSLFKL
jgi:hypothetical protein